MPIAVIDGQQRSHSNALWAAFDNTESRLDGRERHVVGHYRLGQPFQRERAAFFERYGFLDRDSRSLSDKPSARPRRGIALRWWWERLARRLGPDLGADRLQGLDAVRGS